MTPHVIHWFEIPTVDIDRACRFYEAILGHPAGSMKPMDFGPGRMAFFPQPHEHSVSGALWHDPHSKPSPDGVRIYLGADGTIDAVLGRVPGAGGAVVMPKTSIGQHGFIALFSDCEGNVIGLHSTTA